MQAQKLEALLRAYMNHVDDEEGTDFLHFQDQRDYVANQANLTLDDRLEFERIVSEQHIQQGSTK